MWHVSSDTWHRTHDTSRMVIIFSKFQVPSSYGFGMIEKWHLRGISIDKRQYFSVALGNTWHAGGERVHKKVQVISKCIIISPWQNLPIRLVLMFSSISKSTSFLLKLDLRCKLPNFKCVSNTSATNQGSVKLPLRYAGVMMALTDMQAGKGLSYQFLYLLLPPKTGSDCISGT